MHTYILNDSLVKINANCITQSLHYHCYQSYCLVFGGYTQGTSIHIALYITYSFTFKHRYSHADSDFLLKFWTANYIYSYIDSLKKSLYFPYYSIHYSIFTLTSYSKYVATLNDLFMLATACFCHS